MRTLPLAFVLALIAGTSLTCSAAFAQRADAFAAACLKKQSSTPSNCACQSKLARANLDSREQRAALSALNGDKASFTQQVKAMGEAKARTFSGKMQKLGEMSRAQCR